MTRQSTRPAPSRPWLHQDTRVAVLVQGQGVRGGTVARIDDQGVWLRWDVGVWAQEPGTTATRTDVFDAHTLTDKAKWIRARILAPEEGVPVPAAPVIHDEAALTRWPYVELPIAIAEYPCAVSDCTSHSTGEPFDPGRELLFWLEAALPGFDHRSDLYVKMASRLAPANVDIPEGWPSLGPARGAFALTHVPLPHAAEIAALVTWTMPDETDPVTGEPVQEDADAEDDVDDVDMDDPVVLDFDIRPAHPLAEDEDPTPETTWLVNLTFAHDLTR